MIEDILRDCFGGVGSSRPLKVSWGQHDLIDGCLPESFHLLGFLVLFDYMLPLEGNDPVNTSESSWAYFM